MSFLRSRHINHRNIVLTVFLLFTVILITCIVKSSSGLPDGWHDGIRSLSEGWNYEGDTCSIEDISLKEPSDVVAIERQLPADLADDDSLCFEATNLNIRISVDGREIYSFVSAPNLSGLGYGTGYHLVGLSREDSGKTVRIEYTGSNPKFVSGHGHITDIYVCPQKTYTELTLKQNVPTILFSILLIFFGIVFIMISFVISDKERMPFDTVYLGLAALFIGIWLLTVSNVFQLLTGHIYLIRGLNRYLLLLAGFPLIGFYNSLTKKRSRIYPTVELVFVLFWMGLVTVLRYAADIDMLHSFPRMVMFYFGQLLILTIVMFADNEIYCKANGLDSGLRYYYVGIAIFAGFVLADSIRYSALPSKQSVYGLLTSVGTAILVAIVLMQFLVWWTKDRAMIERGRFVNKALDYALSSDDAEENIKLLIKYIGREFKAGRVIIFEDKHNGRFAVSYGWIDESLGDRSVDLIYVPQKGFVDEVLRSYAAHDNTFILRDIESYRPISMTVYNMLKSYEVKNVVMSPLEVENKAIGMVGILDLPDEMINDAAEVSSLVSYFLTQMILRRDEQKRMNLYKYNDALSGALNRRAFDEFVNERLDLSAPFGYLLVEINDLNKVSAREGYDAGDRMVADTVSAMTDVFGRENVYRMVGSRFSAFGFETDETYFNDDVERFMRQIKMKGISVSIGPVYCSFGARDLKTVINHASEIMAG